VVTEQVAIPAELTAGTGPGGGWLELVTTSNESLYVDGEFIGRGPRRQVPVSAGPHRVRVSRAGVSREAEVQVAAGMMTRAQVPLDEQGAPEGGAPR
jgi:hypothetical protein